MICPRGDARGQGEGGNRRHRHRRGHLHAHPAPEGRLSDGPVGAAGRVVSLDTPDPHDAEKLMALGVLPGVDIRLLRRFPSFVFQIGYAQFAVDRELAEKIHVSWDSTGPPRPRSFP